MTAPTPAPADAATDAGGGGGTYDFVVVANRLPVDQVSEDDGSTSWRRSPGGLVTALEPVMRAHHGAWVGWSGAPGPAPEPFDVEEMRLVPVGLSEDEVAEYYEGFSNATLWPLYHDVIAPPIFHRRWWSAYVGINRRFAEAAAGQAADGAVVWVHDYQLQLVPGMLRELRPDLRIGFFNHIPFPGYEIYAQMPWRRQIVEGLLGADLIGFQRSADVTNFLRACRRTTGRSTRGTTVRAGDRVVRAAPFPISIDTAGLEELARSEPVRARAREIREAIGDPHTVLLGVDRLDYTKGILHRLKAYGELLADGRMSVEGTVLIQVASPSRERVGQYQVLRDEVELMVARINGDYGTLGHPPVHYLHQSHPREEMAALYLAADVMLVTSLRDGMNLVAKEYVACRTDETGGLVLSEFTGAADELTTAYRINPHDIDGLKDAMCRAAGAEPRELRRRMRSMRNRIRTHDVSQWAEDFLRSLEHAGDPAAERAAARSPEEEAQAGDAPRPGED